MNTYKWLVRREIWENRAIWTLPLAIGAVLLLAALFGRVEFDVPFLAVQTHSAGALLLFAFGAVFFFVMSIYSAWYLLDSLYADRKDRSILFWKSLPVSDAETVIAKLATGLLVIPVVYFVVADSTTLIIAFIVSLRARTWLGASLWNPEIWLQLQVLWIYLILTIAIWFLPVAAWLLLVSAWAKRSVTLWSIMPPLALVWAEKMFFGTHLIGEALSDRLMTGYPATAFHDFTGSLAAAAQGTAAAPLDVWKLLAPVDFVASPSTWIGVAVGVALVAAAIKLRARSVEL